MNQQTIQDLALDGVDIGQAIADEQSIPAAWYSSKAAHEFETAEIFERSWTLAGPAHLLAETGSRIILQLGRVPAVIVRAQDGGLNGFVNVCPHRGFIVACTEERRNTLQCGYHAWTFNLDGSLRRAPRTDNEPRFDPTKVSLEPILVVEAHGLVFANADPDAIPFDEFYPDFDEAMTTIGFAPDRYRYVGRTEIQVSANWKLWVENGRECYHCSTVHSSTLLTELTGDVEELLYVNMAIDRNPSHDGSWEATSAQIFPGGLILQDPYIMKLGVTVPNGPDSATFISYDYLSRDKSEADARPYLDLWADTFQEDAVAVALQHRGLASGRIARAQLQPLSEKMTCQQHQLTWEAYRRGLNRAT
jgi:choline monooxygenase